MNQVMALSEAGVNVEATAVEGTKPTSFSMKFIVFSRIFTILGLFWS